MNVDWRKGLRIRGPAAPNFIPPAAVEETAWDILLALRSDRGCELSLEKLAKLVSVRPSALRAWLALLEQERLISGTRHRLTGEVRAMLTPSGRDRLDRYLAATGDLRVGTCH